MCPSVYRLYRTNARTVANRWVLPKIWRSKWEMAYGESSDHVTDDVTWHLKAKVMTPICLGPNISKQLEMLFSNIANITLDSPLWGSTVGYPSDSLASCLICQQTGSQRRRDNDSIIKLKSKYSTVCRLVDTRSTGAWTADRQGEVMVSATATAPPTRPYSHFPPLSLSSISL